jgi:hypothetical protein
MKIGAEMELKKVAINIMRCAFGKIYSGSDPDPIFQVITKLARDLHVTPDLYPEKTRMEECSKLFLTKCMYKQQRI